MSSRNKIDTLFHASSIAILGASKDQSKPGSLAIQNLKAQGYQGEIYPINPNYTEIAGLEVFSSILQVPSADVAIVALPVRHLKQAIKDCAQKNVKTVVIFTAGLAEIGDEGKHLQDELVSIAHSNSLRLVGPNCFGVANLINGTISSFSRTFSLPNLNKGSVGFVSQSGGIGLNLHTHAEHEGIGFNYWATTGNEADLEFSDFVAYMVERPEVKVIGGYIETLKNGKKFKRVARRALDLKKPLVLLKVGTTEIGERAVLSHTGSLAGADNVYDTLFRQYGVIRAKDKAELLDTLKIYEGAKRPKGNRVGIITTSGGNGIMLTDYAIECGLSVTETSPKIKEKLKNTLSPFASIKNPIDVTTHIDSNSFKECVKHVIKDDQFDSIIISSSALYKLLGDSIKDLSNADKLVCLVSSHISPQTREIAQKHKIPYFEDISRCVKALSNIVKYERFYINHEFIKKTEKSNNSISVNKTNLDIPNVSGMISEWEAKKILSSIIPIPKGKLVSTLDDAITVSNNIGYPIVMKVNSTKIAHKTDIGGVKINLKNEKEVENAFKEIINNVTLDGEFEGILIEEFISQKGIEVVVGFNKDPIFGHFITFGLGGIFVELLQDFSTRVLPINEQEIFNLMKEIKGWAVLEGYRENVSYDTDALAKMILNLSMFIEKNSDQIDELEFNPIKVLPKGEGVMALDVLWKLK